MATNNILARLAVQIVADNAKFGPALAQSQKQLGEFGKSLGAINNILTAFGVGFGAVQIVNGLRAAIGVIADFESSMSQVRAITGATGSEFEALSKDALRLGAATKFTSKEVSQLQVAFGRLGFSTKEILDATEATLSLAAATGEDLAKSADVAGSTVRSFGLNASETQRVVDVMASSFNKTALGLENFSEAMKYVAPIAATANISVEETTALLGTLADAGIRGSQAGTSLRKIITDMGAETGNLSEKLQKLAAKGLSGADAMDEVGRTAYASLLVLTKNTAKTEELANAFQHAGGEAEKMARVMQDNLTGDVEKLSSAWEGLILALGKSATIRDATQDLTAFINAINGIPDQDEGLRQLVNAIKEDAGQLTIDGFVDKLKEVRKELGKPIDESIASELSEKFKLTDEQAGRLYESILKVNTALSFQEKAIKQFNEFATRNKYGDLSKAADDYKSSLYNLILAEQQRAEGFRKTNITGGFDDEIKKSEEQVGAYRKVIDIVNGYVTSQQKGTQAINTDVKATEAQNKVKLRSIDLTFLQTEGLQEYIKAVNDSFITNVKFSDTLSTFNNNFADSIKVTKDKVKAAAAELRADVIEPMKETAEEIQIQAIEIGRMISNSIAGIAEALGESLATGNFRNFGKSLLEAVASFAQQLGGLMIAMGVGEIALKGAPGPAKIIAGAALVAAGAAIKSLLSKQKNFPNAGTTGSGGSGGVSSSSRVPATGGEQRIFFEARFKLLGNDLVASIDSTNAQNQRLRGG